jgi:hypothetical protein
LAGLRLNEIGELAITRCTLAHHREMAFQHRNAAAPKLVVIGLTDSPIWTNIIKITR